MKLMFIGDVHAADAPPSKRTDSYKDEILEKLREIVEIAEKEAVDAVLFAGDIFHHKEPRRVSHRLIQELIEIFLSFPEGVTVYILVGNHDITMGRLDSLEKQPLGVLGGLPNVELLMWNCERLSADVLLHPIPGVPGVEVSHYEAFRPREVKHNIIVSHQSVVPDKKKEMAVLRNKSFIHDAAEVAKTTTADIVLYGHQHRRDGVYTKKGRSKLPYERSDKLFVNLGSICRGTIGDEDLNKKPAVFILDLLDEGYEYKEIELTRVRPSSEVFKLEEHFEQKSRREDIDEAASLRNNMTVESLSIDSVIATTPTRDDVGENVKQKALELLQLGK